MYRHDEQLMSKIVLMHINSLGNYGIILALGMAVWCAVERHHHSASLKSSIIFSILS